MELRGHPQLHARRLLDARGNGTNPFVVSIKHPLNPDDQIVYGLETGAAYSVGAIYHGLANNSMTDEQRRTLPPDSAEYKLRVGGSKLQLMGWSSYTLLLWLLKLCMCIFYTRLT